LPNVKEHAPPPAGAHSETGVEVQTTLDSADKAAGGGCRVSPCSESSSLPCVIRLNHSVHQRMAKLKLLVKDGELDRAGVIAAASKILKESVEVVKVPLHGGESVTFELDNETA